MAVSLILDNDITLYVKKMQAVAGKNATHGILKAGLTQLLAFISTALDCVPEIDVCDEVVWATSVPFIFPGDRQ